VDWHLRERDRIVAEEELLLRKRRARANADRRAAEAEAASDRLQREAAMLEVAEARRAELAAAEEAVRARRRMAAAEDHAHAQARASRSEAQAEISALQASRVRRIAASRRLEEENARRRMEAEGLAAEMQTYEKQREIERRESSEAAEARRRRGEEERLALMAEAEAARSREAALGERLVRQEWEAEDEAREGARVTRESGKEAVLIAREQGMQRRADVLRGRLQELDREAALADAARERRVRLAVQSEAELAEEAAQRAAAEEEAALEAEEGAIDAAVAAGRFRRQRAADDVRGARAAIDAQGRHELAGRDAAMLDADSQRHSMAFAGHVSAWERGEELADEEERAGVEASRRRTVQMREEFTAQSDASYGRARAAAREEAEAMLRGAKRLGEMPEWAEDRPDMGAMEYGDEREHEEEDGVGREEQYADEEEQEEQGEEEEQEEAYADGGASGAGSEDGYAGDAGVVRVSVRTRRRDSYEDEDEDEHGEGVGGDRGTAGAGR